MKVWGLFGTTGRYAFERFHGLPAVGRRYTLFWGGCAWASLYGAGRAV